MIMNSPYIWSAFLVSAVGLVVEPWLLALRRRNIVDYLRRGADPEED